LDSGVELVQQSDESGQIWLTKGEPTSNGWETDTIQDPGWDIVSHVHPGWSGASDADYLDLIARGQISSKVVFPNGSSVPYSID